MSVDDSGQSRFRAKRHEETEDKSSKYQRAVFNDEIDKKYGFERYTESPDRVGWLINMHPADILDEDQRLVSAVDFYFVEDTGGHFKVSYPYQPYFYIHTSDGAQREVSSFLSRKFTGRLAGIDMVEKENLDLANHLVGLKNKYLKLRFHTVEDLIKAKRDIMPAVKRNKEREKSKSAYDPSLFTGSGIMGVSNGGPPLSHQMDYITDIREYDVPYHVRVAIDNKINAGHWYVVKGRGLEAPLITLVEDEPDRPDPVVLAFDIETTKLPLKFPDSATDVIIMISYMIDGQGYLITNREIVGEDVDNFEYTPKPEYEGPFIIFNEPNEISLIKHFFDHVLQVKPNIISTYNGDYFDWPFIETRADFHGISMMREIGFSPDSQNEYKCRPCIHMDAYRWVKRDSYLPVGSQNLKAVTRAKLRYDPVELDPEDMCRMASEQPQLLANYSVSDAVATYYLYMKYVHPFIFALCTIIPMEPDEVLRKGSGTLCEALLMVQAYHGNIIFPNKQETIFNKLTEDGHVLDTETYVGGHVEALESGVFRSDIPSRFRISTDMVQQLIDGVQHTMKHALENEEKIPLENITDFEEVCGQITNKLILLKENPLRVECPLIYHLDVGAMYPNIILTNRLQPSAIVDEVTCASCDFNKPGATCQRKMSWKWRGDYMPASRNEYQSIKLQLESENFPGLMPGDPSRSFHHLPIPEQAALEKKRLTDYCRRAYKRVKHTREELKMTTVCQRENSFYVDTVRAFRDRRYEFKGLLKFWKKKLDAAKQKNDGAEIKSCQNKEILYDSLQLAHKCILNSFYGYVMRKGARWYSMEMAGIVCYTGANIITKAREIIELIGRPLELDTDGIWCILPSSFPENFEFKTVDPKKPKVTVSYPGAMLNIMVQDNFTNHQYQELVDNNRLVYEQRSENSIFFEVDGPYRAMILPSSKEEGKRLKKRYAVFNYDGTLAELKGFEVKRRGELQLIKNFQSSVFEAFLSGSTLQECYESVGKVANFWLDVLYYKAGNMPDSELFELISENRNMSRKLEDYGDQKSSSIMTAKRLAEFLGDQMVKDAGLSCRFIIARKPEGSPVTERAIPLAIFQAESSISKHYLSKWLKCSKHDDFDIRNLLDWNYYIERLGNAIQKIVTIPAAMQGISNPVPRIPHPSWLHKRLLEKNDIYKQQKISDMFTAAPQKQLSESQSDTFNRKRTLCNNDDIEETGGNKKTKGFSSSHNGVPSSQKRKRLTDEMTTKSWKELLGKPPSFNWKDQSEFIDWLNYHKKKWNIQKIQRKDRLHLTTRLDKRLSQTPSRGTMTSFLRQRNVDLAESPWQIIQIADTSTPGEFNVWILIGNNMDQVKLCIPRVFYVNSRTERNANETSAAWRSVSKGLPRSVPHINLYEYTVPETIFKEHTGELATQLSSPDIEGVYESNIPLDFRAVMSLGCVCTVNRNYQRMIRNGDIDKFELGILEFKTVAQYPYLEGDCLKTIFLYHSACDSRSMFGIFLSAIGQSYIIPMDNVRTNQMPTMTALYQNERRNRVSRYGPACLLPPEEMTFDIRIETQHRIVYRNINRILTNYKDGHHGPTVILIQSEIGISELRQSVPALDSFPFVLIPTLDSDSNYPRLDWQRPVARRLINQYLNMPTWFQNHLEQARYGHVPVGNLPCDPTIFIADVFFSRNLVRHNHVVWATPSDKPDLGGHEDDDYRLMVMGENNLYSGSLELNSPGLYHSTCVEIALDGIAVTSVLQANHINDYEGGSGTSTSFDYAPQASLEELMSGTTNTSSLTIYDEAALCSSAFKILRTLVHTWVYEVSAHKNYYADLQLQHFYRWIQDTRSYLYEPAICRMIHKLMKKLFMQLIGEFKRLGATIVYADFNRIVICTKKRRVDDACGYVEFILNSIQSRELFHSLHFEPKNCWHMLQWMDKANYGGVSCPLPKQLKNMFVEDADEDDDDEDMEISDNVCEVEMNWNICKYLPEEGSCQEIFKVIIAGHIQALYSHLVEIQKEFEPGNTPIQKRSDPSHTTQVNQDSSIMASSVSFAQNRIEQELSEKLFLITQKMKQSVTVSNQLFPKLPGSYLNFNNPALEFVKFTCKILSLDITTQHQITKLRRDLLKLIGIREFSEEAIFHDPCRSYILCAVICETCNGCRDIDLCRDPFVVIDEQRNRPIWYCSLCGNQYNHDIIEKFLINTVHNRSVSMVVQDLVCIKCKGIKEPNMAQYCTCAGDFTETVQIKDFKELLITFRNIADHFAMFLLQETVMWFLEHT